MVTLNTSRIGENLLNSSNVSLFNNPFFNFLNNITNTINGDIDNAIGDLAHEFGVEDFYSAHLMDYCFGTYVPTALANATVSNKDIHKNVTGCSNQTAMFNFDPTAALQKSLDESGIPITLKDLNWPTQIEQGIHDVQILYHVAFVLYCISIGLSFIGLLTALLAVFANGRLAAVVNIVVTTLAFVILLLVSAIITAAIVRSSNVINDYGKPIGVDAHRGGKFLAITWAATAVMFIAIFAWCAECIIVHRRRRSSTYVGGKHG